MERRRLISFSVEDLSPRARATRLALSDRPPLPVPPTAREFLERGLLPYLGSPPDRRTMTPAHQLELIDRYLGLYRHAGDAPTMLAPAFAREAFACGDGWHGIIDRLSAKLTQDPSLVVSQLKEKIGRLTIYFDPVPEGLRIDPELEARLDAEMEAARVESLRTCELCGRPGRYDVRFGHVGVRCSTCEKLDALEKS